MASPGMIHGPGKAGKIPTAKLPPKGSLKIPKKGLMQLVAKQRGMKGIGRGQYKTKKGNVYTWHGKSQTFAKAKYKTTQPTVPPGMYDPALDAQGRAATRGLEDLRQDTSLGATRSLEDYDLAKGDLTRGRDEGLADILRSGQREGQDYQSALGGLRRQYGIMQQQQEQSQRTAGVDEGGAGLQAQVKRAANMAYEQQPIDIAHVRSGEDLATSRDRLVQGTDRSLGQLGVGYQRGEVDRNTGLTRAVRENRFFGSDLTQQKAYQAKGAGWTPPKATRTLIRPPSRGPVRGPLPKGPKKPKIYDPHARPGKVRAGVSRPIGALL